MIPLTDPVKRMRISRVSFLYTHLTETQSFTRFVGEYKTILQLVGVLSYGKIAKRLTDKAIDLMQDVQNLRKAIYECVRRLGRA